MNIMIQLKVRNHRNPFETLSTTVWTIISNTPQNAKTRKNVEASYVALWKPDLNKQKNFERLVYLEMMSHRAINDIKQTL